MKKVLFTLALCVSSSVLQATPVCVQGTLQDYINLGKGGCTIEDKVFSNFMYAPTAVNAVAPTAAQVAVAPIPGDPLNPGIAFTSGGWTVIGPNKFIDSSIMFDVTVVAGSPLSIHDAELAIAGVNFGGSANVGETVIVAPGLGYALQAWLPGQPVDHIVFAPVKKLTILKDILVSTMGSTNPNAVVSISIVTQHFSQTGVPEPATMALFGAGLVGLGLLKRKRG